jgi:hypothetical protein
MDSGTEALPPKVFISYSHADRDFVAELADDLIRNRVLVWWDEWEIRVGDSLIEKIQDGISGSSYLAVVLSPNSVNSAWVQEELRAAMARQLEEKRTVVLPILLSDCELPLFLKEKCYADFRDNYDKGLEDLLHAMHPPDTLSHSRTETDKYISDYAIEWGKSDDLHGLRIEITSHSPAIPYAVSCKIDVIATKELSARLRRYEEAGFPWAARAMLLVQVEDIVAQCSPTILIQGDLEVKEEYHLRDPKRDTGVDMQVRARRLGSDPGSDVLYEWGSVFSYIANKHREGIRSSLPPDQIRLFDQWRQANPI